MVLAVQSTPSFVRFVKRIHPKDKKVLDDAVKAVATDPTIVEEKRGDLVGVFVYKFKLNNQETLLAYGLRHDKNEPSTVILLAVGPQENFYAQLKRTR